MRPLAVLLVVAGAARADGFADELRYPAQTLGQTLTRLRSADPAVRRAASRALNRVGPEAHEAAPALLMALKSDDEAVRDRVAAALARVGPRAVPLLTAALSFDDDRLRAGAARALRRLGPDARPALRALEHALFRPGLVALRADLLEAVWAASGEPRHLDEAAVLVRGGAVLGHSATFLHRHGRDGG
ncbi:MAG: HEAT repeat domain-containing protein, partial [Gemmataceae bacterium]